MLHYIIQTIAFQLLFLLAYDLFLKNETFFNYNRLYLLLTSVLSLLLPFIKIESLNQVLPNQFMVDLPEVVLGITSGRTKAVVVSEINSNSFFSVINTVNIYLVVAVLVFLFFIYKLFKIIRLIFKNERHKVDKFIIVSLKNTNAAFSFFNFIFLGETLLETEKQHILKHERVHAKQKHSLDLLWFELLKVIFWFNPLIYFYQSKISNLHEFIADNNAVKTNKSNYYKQLLQQAFSVKSCSFINPFFKQSLIKKRIIMLQKSKSKPAKLAKYLLLIPMLLGMLVYTSCNNLNNNQSDIVELEVGTEIPYFINRVKEQIAIQGNVSEEEEKALNLLYKVTKGKEFDPKLVEEVQQLINKKNKSELEQRLSALFNSIQIKGNLTDSDDDAIEDLLALTIKDSFKDSFFDDAIKRIDIPFGVVEKTPVFPGCETTNEEENKKCFADKMTKHVMKNFNAKLADNLGLEKGVKKVYVSFKISKTGEIIDIKSRAPHADLEVEANRIISMLPKITPGSHEGKTVDVGYTLPIAFKIQ